MVETTKNATNSLVPYAKQLATEERITSSPAPTEDKPDNSFKYNCHTRSDIIKRSKKYKQNAKMQKKARRNNRSKK
jgi:hypothetical protein